MPDPDEKVLVFSTPRGFVNPYSFYLPKEIKAWPRGLPLELISSSDVDFAAASPESATNLEDLEFKIALWQGLVDGDPDLDAIHRLVYQSEFDFIKKEPIVLEECILHSILKIRYGWIQPFSRFFISRDCFLWVHRYFKELCRSSNYGEI